VEKLFDKYVLGVEKKYNSFHQKMKKYPRKFLHDIGIKAFTEVIGIKDSLKFSHEVVIVLFLNDLHEWEKLI